jgi:shikimate kinase
MRTKSGWVAQSDFLHSRSKRQRRRSYTCVEQLENTQVQLENAKAEVQKPFPQEEELKTKSARLNELNAMLNLDKRENEIVDSERGEEEPQKSSADRER